MKIAQISKTYLPSVGGVQNYIYRLARDLTDKGEIVDVLASDIDLKQPISGKHGDFNVKYFRATFTVMKNPFIFGLVPHLMRHRYDLIHIHSLWAFPSIISALFKRRAKLITTAHGVTPDSKNRLLDFTCTCYMPFVKFICKRSDKIIVLGQKDRQKLINLFDVTPSKIEVIPNGIEIESLSEKTIQKLMQKYDIENYKIILFTGRVSPVKNPEILIKAFEDVHNKVNKTKLIFVGPISDSYRSKLIDLARGLNIDKSVVFTGEVNRENVLSTYCCADIFVSLGGWEGLPTTMLEAMSLGLPCIMFNSGGIEDIIKDGETGLIVNELDCKKIADKIRSLLEDRDLREGISKNAKKNVLGNYLWENCFERIYQLYGNYDK